jgi:hypothetical protein
MALIINKNKIERFIVVLVLLLSKTRIGNESYTPCSQAAAAMPAPANITIAIFFNIKTPRYTLLHIAAY